MNCDKFRELVFDYSNNLIKDDEILEAFEIHLLKCNDCWKFIKVDELLNNPKVKEHFLKLHVKSKIEEINDLFSNDKKAKALQSISYLISIIPPDVETESLRRRLLKGFETEVVLVANGELVKLEKKEGRLIAILKGKGELILKLGDSLITSAYASFEDDMPILAKDTSFKDNHKIISEGKYEIELSPLINAAKLTIKVTTNGS